MAASQRKPVDPPVNTTGWLTREQVVDLLGVSYTTISNWERKGILHPGRARSAKYQRDVIVYDPAELAATPRARAARALRADPGEIEARVFALLEAGKNLREIVIECRIPTTEALAIRETWLDLGGGAAPTGPDREVP
jgi:transcriptional regulator with XRE-family HTH domain